MVETEDAAEETVDNEEDSMRQKLQAVMRSCAGSLGLETVTPKIVELADDGEELVEDADKTSNKRQRSLEPFGHGPKPPSS